MSTCRRETLVHGRGRAASRLRQRFGASATNQTNARATRAFYNMARFGYLTLNDIRSLVTFTFQQGLLSLHT